MAARSLAQSFASSKPAQSFCCCCGGGGKGNSEDVSRVGFLLPNVLLLLLLLLLLVVSLFMRAELNAGLNVLVAGMSSTPPSSVEKMPCDSEY